MNCESRITLEETPVFAAAATAIIDDRLARLSEADRASYWHSIKKAYNTPYNDPPRRKRADNDAAIVDVAIADLAMIAVPSAEYAIQAA